MQDYGWSVVEKWSPAYLEAQVEELSFAYSSSKTRFVHYTDTVDISTLQTTAEILGDINWKPTYQPQHLTPKDFFRQLQDPKVGIIFTRQGKVFVCLTILPSFYRATNCIAQVL